ncbi:autoinducer 2 ABC transporter substrate-binding protein [Neobacillus sp. PS3-12]|uniref:autoinducer 2 ABC transporter substrate-binding protein n=1 Tax=Neobacillus sp. PS3-12 TaxID=3070677 RepID=UPI0027E0FEE8|nr:autoinducer 2 ABC transporter substrate-binding protein [Neobacillus sp. PS3-12]WML54814.1 autoinducer 2 ABC transporter substrate-binding protein [Neobacillus sp. PS3-12]
MKKSLIVFLVVMLMLGIVGCSGASKKTTASADGKKKKFTIVMVAKHEGISWFDDMRVGIKQFAKDYNVNAYQIAPEGGDPAKQAQMVEDLIAQGVDAILAVPNDPKSLDPVLKKAKAAGIVVVTHEASDISKDVDYDMEAFNNKDFGVRFFEGLAKSMNYEGKFTGFVGGLTMTTHMQWYQAGLDYIKKKYPKMEMIDPKPYEDLNDNKVAYDKTIEILKAHPDIKGLFDMAASGAGVAQALQDKNRNDVALSSLALPSMSAGYIKNGIMDYAQAWRPADAGYVTALIAYKILNGEKLSGTVDLKKPGYEKSTVNGKLIIGNAPVEFTKDNVDNYKF